MNLDKICLITVYCKNLCELW